MTKKALKIFAVLTAIFVAVMTCTFVFDIKFPLTTDIRITAATIFFASLCILICIAVKEQNKSKLLSLLGISLSIIGAILLCLCVWIYDIPVSLTVISISITLYALATVLSSVLYLANLSRKYNWSLWLALIANYSFSTIGTIWVAFDNVHIPEIVDILLFGLIFLVPVSSIMVLIFHILSTQKGDSLIQVLCPHCGLEQDHLTGKITCENCQTIFEVKIIKIGEQAIDQSTT